MSEMNEATLAQIRAADPDASTWLSANAGSGKTRVLTDRVARLLLRGVPPQRILCLTYTKAAASEMQNRLFQRLGAWAMLDDEALSKSLAELGADVSGNLDRARTLFARAIETPGGLKIQTIHSFCATLLRQFPLEAGVSPQFREIDDLEQLQVIDTVLEGLAVTHPDVLETMGRLNSGAPLSQTARSVAGNARAFGPGEAEAFATFGLPPNATIAHVHAEALQDGDLSFLQSLPATLLTSDKITDQKLAEVLENLDRQDESGQLDALFSAFLVKKTSAAKIGKLPTAALRKGAFAPFSDRFDTIMRQVEAAFDTAARLKAAEKTKTLHAFARIFLPAYADAKAQRGLLDFDDLIGRASALLRNVDMAWILFRLDGGIDHILVDEAQDTSPAQWSVISALTEEITAGHGARDVKRTLFVVGDKKQSIYSFQGADADGFDEMRDTFASALAPGPGLQSHSLLHSFRSAPAILDVVDSVFSGAQAAGLGNTVEHRAFHADMPGRVDLWDLEKPVEKPDDPPWYDPVDRVSKHSPQVRLARKVAKHLNDILKTGSISGESGEIRSVSGGDILVLVRGRGALFDAIIQACKTEQLPVAGADRLRVNAELAVRDLIALLSFFALPEDDLSLAAALRSPIFGWSEQQLYRLAQPRPKGQRLWTALRDSRDAHPDTFEALIELRRRADILRPFELLETILTRMEGRRALVERLGSEAEDGIDELLNQALSYELTQVPTLTGFLTRVQAEDVDIKRQTESSAGLIRVMTVHGAKGLEAPIVVLPDTVHAQQGRQSNILTPKGSAAVWNMPKEDAPTILQNMKDDARRAAEEEDNRLLYVAMTRAAQWLIVAGAEGEKTVENSWWSRVASGMGTIGATRIEEGEHAFLRYQSGAWKEPKPAKMPELETESEEIAPAFAISPPPQSADGTVMSPSNLGGEKVLQSEDADLGSDLARERGTWIHLLLEHLPTLPRDTWLSAAGSILSRPEEEVSSVLAEASRVIDACPDLFRPEVFAEVGLTGRDPATGAIIYGAVDRLVVEVDKVLIADFKSNASVPETPENTPNGLLRQMGAYLVVAEQIWPRHEIVLEIIWTQTAGRMVIPHAIVRKALEETPIS